MHLMQIEMFKNNNSNRPAKDQSGRSVRGPYSVPLLESPCLQNRNKQNHTNIQQKKSVQSNINAALYF